MRYSFSLVVLSVAACLAAPPAAAEKTEGRTVYADHCAVCHGSNGRPDLPNVPSFKKGERLQVPDVALIRSIKNGKGMCPSQRHAIEDEEIMAVVSYIRTLRR